MTLKEVRELLKTGNTIQYKESAKSWITVKEDEGIAFKDDPSMYRVAPAAKLRPWKMEEAIGKIVKYKKHSEYAVMITGVDGNTLYSAGNGFASGQWYLDNCEQLDGSPCGVMEE